MKYIYRSHVQIGNLVMDLQVLDIKKNTKIQLDDTFISLVAIEKIAENL